MGIVAGLGEGALLTFSREVLGSYTHVNPQYVWMGAIAYGLLAAAIVVPVALLGRRWTGRRRLSVAIFLAGTLTFTGVLFVAPRLHGLAALVLAAGVSLQLGRMAAARPRLARRVIGTGLPAALAAVLLIALVINGSRALSGRRMLGSSPAAPAGAPNILLIIWDTVRAASLSVYGYERETTPTLERIAGESFVFDRALSTAPWTLPSHASMFTGLYPSEVAADWEAPLEDGPPTLAEVLRDHGYATGGFAANVYYVSRESGLHRGFTHYADFPAASASQLVMSTALARQFLGKAAFWRRLGVLEPPGRRLADHVQAEFLDWQSRTDRPFFAFLNLLDGHAPYLPPSPFDTAFGPRLPGRDPNMVEGREFTAAELRAEIDAYDGAIRYLDDRLDRLLEELDRRGVLENTIVVVTSDHGEEFGEHGYFTHGATLYPAALHVPLLIRPAGDGAGRRISEWVTLRDLPATLLDMAGVRPDHGLGGSSLARHWGAPAGATDTLFAFVSRTRGQPSHYPVSSGDLAAVFAQPFEFIRRSDGDEEFLEFGVGGAYPWGRKLALTEADAGIAARLRARADAAPGRNPNGSVASPE